MFFSCRKSYRSRVPKNTISSLLPTSDIMFYTISTPSALIILFFLFSFILSLFYSTRASCFPIFHQSSTRAVQIPDRTTFILSARHFLWVQRSPPRLFSTFSTTPRSSLSVLNMSRGPAYFNRRF